MPGPPPKDPAIRRRRNRTSTRAALHVVPGLPVPSLPEREEPWHDLTLAWWRDVWASPMAPEFLDADLHGLYILAQLVDAFWAHPTPNKAAEIRLQRRDFGLTPLDRRRLQWEIAHTEEALRKNPPTPRQRSDPRRVLEAVNT